MSIKNIFAKLGNVVLTVLAVLGGLGILFAVLAFTMNLSIILFKTGSMEPTIPAGSAAIVQKIPATQANVGDIVTVERPGEDFPITHRIVEKEDVDGTKVRLTLRGDANTVNDPAPYEVEKVRIVWFHIPKAAYVFQLLVQPWLVITLVLSVSLIVAWSFLYEPKQEEEESEVPRTGRHKV